MVDTLEPYNKVLIYLQDNLAEILAEILLSKGDFIVKLIQEEQLSKGLDGDGNVIGVYKPITEFYYAKINPPIRPKKTGKPYNFEWTGGWFKGMIATIKDETTYEIFSIDGKHRLLIEKYGDNITKLSTELNQYVNEEILKPELYNYFVNALFDAA